MCESSIHCTPDSIAIVLIFDNYAIMLIFDSYAIMLINDAVILQT